MTPQNNEENYKSTQCPFR